MKKIAQNYIISNVASQVLSLVSALIVSFYFDAQNISNYAIVLSGIAVASILFSFRLENLIFRLTGSEVKEISLLLVSIVPGISLVAVTLILFVLKISNEGLLPFQQELAIFIVLGGFTLSIFNITLNILVKTSKSNLVILIKLLRGFSELTISLTLFLFSGKDISSFYIGYVSSFIIPVIFIFIVGVENRRKYLFSIFESQRYSSYWHFIKNSTRYLMYDLPASLFNIISLQAPVFILKGMSSVDLVAAYFIFQKFIGSPSLTIAQGLGLAIKQNINEIKESTTKSGFSTKLLSYINIVSVLVITVLGMLGTQLFLLFDIQVEPKTLSLVGITIFPVIFFRSLFNLVAGVVYVKGLFKFNFLFQAIGVLIAVIPGFVFIDSFDYILLYGVLMAFFYIIGFKFLKDRVVK